jgi:type II secretory pathway pseudopilin PulG
MKNQGISLISLIITIIVIIILAAIVIFSGMDTPERAQLANFGQQVSNVNAAIVDQIAGVSTTFATEGKTRNTEQMYYKLATGVDCGQYGTMNTFESDDIGKQNSGEKDSKCQNIIVAHAKEDSKNGGLSLTLPDVREHDEAWYITEKGQIFNATGFVSGGKTYFTSDLYVTGELKVDAGDNNYYERADLIAAALVGGYAGDLSATDAGDYQVKVSATTNGEISK